MVWRAMQFTRNVPFGPGGDKVIFPVRRMTSTGELSSTGDAPPAHSANVNQSPELKNYPKSCGERPTMSFKTYQDIKETRAKNARNTGLVAAVGGLGTMAAVWHRHCPQLLEPLDTAMAWWSLDVDPLSIALFSGVAAAYAAFRAGKQLHSSGSLALMRRAQKEQYLARDAYFQAKLKANRLTDTVHDPEGKYVASLTDYAHWLRRQRGDIRRKKAMALRAESEGV